MEEPSAPPPRRSGPITGLHPASHQPPFPSQPECLLETEIRSCQSLLKTSQRLPTELSIRDMPSPSSKIPQDAPPTQQTSALASSTSRTPQPQAPYLPPQGPCTCCSRCLPQHLHRAGAFLSVRSQFQRHRQRSLAAPSKRMPQSVPTIFPAVFILSSYSICDCVMDMNEAPSSVSC